MNNRERRWSQSPSAASTWTTPNKKTILDYIDWTKYQILPNTAGCRTVEEAVFIAKLGRSVTNSNWVKLEVIPDAKYLLPDPIGTSGGRRETGGRGLCSAALHPR